MNIVRIKQTNKWQKQPRMLGQRGNLIFLTIEKLVFHTSGCKMLHTMSILSDEKKL